MIHHYHHHIELTENHISFTVIEVLPFLKGRKVDDRIVRGYLHALRPSSIKINWTKADARTWRVNITTDENGVIEKIEQEVEIGCYDGVRDGHELECLLNGWPYSGDAGAVYAPHFPELPENPS